jgi:hypothetical protein
MWSFIGIIAFLISLGLFNYALSLHKKGYGDRCVDYLRKQGFSEAEIAHLLGCDAPGSDDF